MDTARESVRKFVWDEEDRLLGVDLRPENDASQPHIAAYTYDASGERGIRYVPRQQEGVSSGTTAGYAQDMDIMLYPNALITVRPQEFPEHFDPMRIHPEHIYTTYTKHYYIGSERINSKLGTVNNLGMLCEEVGGADLIQQMNSKAQEANQRLNKLYLDLNKELEIAAPYLYSTNHSLSCGFKSHNPKLYDAYWYHPDHLGSSSFITNTTGEISQHLEYLPFGETLVEEHLNSYNSPFKFNGKEYDAETGNYYYGARYLNPKWSTFLTPDPALESYPGISPYTYTLNNPVRYVDPTGMYVEERDDDYIIDQQGNINLIRKTDDSFDRILQTDKQGDIKTKGNSFLVSKSERGKEKVAVDNIAKGILKDGLNLKEKNGSFDVNRENQPTLEEFDKFISEFSDYIKIEIAGIRLGRDVENDLVDRVQTYRYKENTQFTAKTPKSWFEKFGSHLKSHFHTHPYGDHRPSPDVDIPLRKKHPNLKFFIIASGYEKGF